MNINDFKTQLPNSALEKTTKEEAQSKPSPASKVDKAAQSVITADSEILFSPALKQVLGDAPAVDDLSRALYLVSIAKSDELQYVPEVLKEHPKIPIAELVIVFIEKVKKIKFEHSYENARAIALCMIDRLGSLYFHGTHSRHLDSILKNGLSGKLANANPNLDKINRIFNEVLGEDHGMFGYRYLNAAQNGEQIFVTSRSSDAISYALTSPEWFQLFVGEESYRQRNKDEALKHLEQMSIRWKNRNPNFGGRKMTDDEVKEVLEFFDTTWEYYKEQRPVVFRVIEKSSKTPEQVLDENLKKEAETSAKTSDDTSCKDAASRKSSVDQTTRIKQFIQDWLTNDELRNIRLNAIPPENLTPFFLPIA